MNTKSAAETLAALDYVDETSFRASVLRIRHRERGAAAARTYLRDEVAPADRNEVLRLAGYAA